MNIFNLNTTTKLLIAVLVSIVFIKPVEAQVTGLSDYEIFLDPGHSQKENLGLFQYSEAEKVLRVALAIKSMFENQTDIKTVYMSRLTDNDYISLSGRSDLANSLNPDFYYSIHSNAGSETKNDAFSMYGGWRSKGVTVEKSPNGGKAFGDFLASDLAGVMRIPTLGNYADRVFYQGNVYSHGNQWPYLSINRKTTMASILSEAGFHTNPSQQQKNLNADWKKMEALSAFRSFLKYKGLEVPVIGVASGIITDVETGKPINGATVVIDGQSYITDTYESLFNKYSNDPDQLSNGFYWIEGLTPNQAYPVGISADGYNSTNKNLTIKSNTSGSTSDNISFLDIALTSNTPSIVGEITVEEGNINNVVPGKNIYISFSRKMDRASVESAISIAPSVPLTYSWSNDFKLIIHTDKLGYETEYTITIDATVAKNSLSGQFLDGDKDGVAGGDFELLIKSAPEDQIAPKIIDQYPVVDGSSPEIRPVIRIVYDEKLLESSVGNDAISISETASGNTVSGTIKYTAVNDKSVIHFFPTTDLENDLSYKVTVKAGLADMFGNGTDLVSFNFTVKEEKITELNKISNGFDSDISGWWQPSASGSTKGVISDETSSAHSTIVKVISADSGGSMKLSYGWDLAQPSWYIREYFVSKTSKNYKFSIDNVLQMYVFGDGSDNQFRFMIKDGNAEFEASKWFAIDWVGWKLISWDLSKDDAVGWVNGNGVVNGSNGFYIDGIHLKHVDGAKNIGTLYFDELRYVKRSGYGLSTNDEKYIEVSLYPNPTSGTINIVSDIDIEKVEIYDITGQLVMFNKFSDSSVNMSLNHLSKGLYIVRIITDEYVINRKIDLNK